jgi:hypothetical protein
MFSIIGGIYKYCCNAHSRRNELGSEANNYYQVQLIRYLYDIGLTVVPTRDLQNSNTSKTMSVTQYGIKTIGRTAVANGIYNGDDIEDTYDTRITDAQSDVEERVIFWASPTVSESRSVEYVDQGLPGPVGIVVYATTGNRRYTISAKFVSRTVVEASQTYQYISLLKSWMLPQTDRSLSSLIGRPPVIRLNGYKNQLNNVPVVLSDLSITFPDDVDYIETEYAVVPIIQSVDLTLIESHAISTGILTTDQKIAASTVLESDFTLVDFQLGRLPGY